MCKHCGDPKIPFHYTGKASALYLFINRYKGESEPCTAKVDELIAAGINLRYKVRVK
jgi:hypothetical protein